MRKWVLGCGVVAFAAIGLLAVAGCQTAAGNVSGKVTNRLTGKPIAGVVIATDPVISGVSIQTNAQGSYSGKLPVGSYTLAFNKSGFQSVKQAVSVVAGEMLTRDIILSPTSPVAVSAGKDLTGSPGSTVTLKATAEPLDGSTVTAFQWSQTSGTPAAIDNLTCPQ